MHLLCHFIFKTSYQTFYDFQNYYFLRFKKNSKSFPLLYFENSQFTITKPDHIVLVLSDLIICVMTN